MDLKQYWPQIGSSGEKPEDGKQWEYDDPYYEVHLNYIWNGVRQQFGEISAWISDVEDGNISVSEADYASDANATEYKGSDIDTDGDGRVNTADHAVEAEYASDANATEYKGNDIDSDGDGIVDSADHAVEADTAGEAEYAAESGQANSVPVVSSSPSNPDEGDHWIIE